MPLLTCPNDDAPMQPVRRDGIEIDVCTQCRGVWLDRGELEKLLSVVRAADGDDRTSQPVSAQQQQRPTSQPAPAHGYGERGEFGERGESGDDRGYGQKRKRRFDVFDIFD